MAFRCIIVESPAHISVKNSQLVIRTDREHFAAIEDISALLIESRQSSISTSGAFRGCAGKHAFGRRRKPRAGKPGAGGCCPAREEAPPRKA